ncbi:hypothetical protein L6452_24278 [Arctium lappa]|uniref:Uncharacterized protein n=1 Tax=Arctium lappa TaxID=4217 RepID=A0ACB9AA41_ARCLA|nr:hypothetical protein L6452_24278 [Arctium lappa]
MMTMIRVLMLFWVLCLHLYPSSKLIHAAAATKEQLVVHQTTMSSVDRRGGGGGHGGGGHGGGAGARGGGSRGSGRDPGVVVIPVYAGAGAHRQYRTHHGRNDGGRRYSAALPQLVFTVLALVLLLCF